MRDLTNINKEVLVDLLSTATYGCDYLGVLTLKTEKSIDEKFDSDYLENRCCEELWADRLLGGGHIVVVDYEDEDENGVPAKYTLNLEDFKNGLNKARDKEAVRDWADFVEEEDDYYTCNNLLQVIVFGEIVYG
jgi:hypothetical protein